MIYGDTETTMIISFIINHNHPYIWLKIVPNILVNNFVSQCLSGSECSKDQENYDWTTAGLISELFISCHFNCTQFAQEISSNV